MIAQHHPVPPQRADRAVEMQLHHAFLAGREGAPPQHRDPANPVLGAEMDVYRQTGLERHRRGARHAQRHVDARGRRVQLGREKPVAA